MNLMYRSYKSIIHAFDPGKLTGYVKYDRKLYRIDKFDILRGYEDIYKILKQINPFNEMVLFERNVGKMATEDQYYMCKLVGFIEGICKIKNFTNESNPPMIRKGFIDISRKYFLKHFKIGTYKKHNIDAFSHVLQYINKEEGIEKFK